MSKKRVFFGEVKESRGRVRLTCEQDIKLFLKEYVGRRVQVTIEDYRKKRSLSQNAYYWAVVIPHVQELFKEYGDTIDEEEAHYYLKMNIGKITKTITTPSGESVKVPDTSTKVETGPWEDWMQNIRAWAAEYGCIIPLPNEAIEDA